MKIVITGALGHIGSHLSRRFPELLGSNCEMILIDNLITQRYCSLFNLPKSAKYKFIEGDVTKIPLDKIFGGVDAVVHLAAITDAASSFEKAEEVERVNFGATKHVAEACIVTNTPLIMASSTSVYGTQSDKVNEACAISELKPQSPYAETKLMEEDLISGLVKSRGLKAIKFRFGTIFGISAGMRFHTAVNKFCWQAVMGNPLTVWETAYEQKRPYLDIDDCASAVAFAIKNKIFDGEVYNVVTENATVREVVNHIKQNINNVEINFVKHKIMNQLSYEVLNNKISELGFVVQGSLSTGIERTINLISSANSVDIIG